MMLSRPFVVNILLFWAITVVVNVVESRYQGKPHQLSLNLASNSRAAVLDSDRTSSSLTRARRDTSDQLADDDGVAAFEAEMKRFGASGMDAVGKQKFAFRSDLGRKRAGQAAAARHYTAFRTDFGKRELPSKSSVVAAAQENWKRYNSFRSDLGKRFSSFRSDLGKRNDELNDDDASSYSEDETEAMAGNDIKPDRVDVQSDGSAKGGAAIIKRFASFRSDLGKRRAAANMQAFRSDLGK